MQSNQFPKLGDVFIGFERLQFHQFHVALPREVAVGIEHIGDAAGHAGREVASGAAEHDGAPARHVLAGVVAHALDHGLCAAVAHAEAFRALAAEERPPAGGPVQRNVADQDVVGRDERARARRIHDQVAAGEPLADVVVAVALELERDAAGEKRAEALAGRARELDVDRVRRQAALAPFLDEFVAQGRAHRAVGVHDRQLDARLRAARERFSGELDQAVVERAVEAVVLRHRAVDADRVVRPDRRRQDRREIETVGLPVVDGLARAQRVGTADHVDEAAEPELGHDLARFFGDHEEIVDDMLGLACELLPEPRVLGRDAHGTGVQMALAHHDAAERDQRRGREAHFLRAEQRGDDDVAAGLEPAVGLQDRAAAKVVEHERLVRLGDAEFPGQPRVLDAGQRRRAGAPGIARNEHVVGMRLDDAGRDRAHAHLGHELDADAR